MTEGPPNCYGLHWSPNAVECRGGLDPNYTNALGTHRREQCSWYKPCSAKSCATKAQNKNVVPPQRLVTGPTPQRLPIMPGRQQVRAPAPLSSVKQQQHQPVQQQVYHPQHMAHPYVAHQGPQQVPMQFQAPGAQMPAYLSVPEPYNANVPWWKRLVHELGRSAAKSMGHTGASFFDHMTVTKPKPPSEKG